MAKDTLQTKLNEPPRTKIRADPGQPTGLLLPARFEALSAALKEHDLDIQDILVRVEDDIARVRALGKSAETSAMSRVEVFYGETGIGKTTFLQGLPRIFKDLRVHYIPRAATFKDALTAISKDDPSKFNVFVFDKDNPQESYNEFYDFFSDLQDFYKKVPPNRVLIWTIKHKQKAEQAAKAAQDAGSSSLVDPFTQGFYEFKGLRREEFYAAADKTCRALNGKSLTALGISPLQSEKLIADYELQLKRPVKKISDYLDAVRWAYDRARGTTTPLVERPQIQLWVVVAGDDPKRLVSSVRSISGAGRRVESTGFVEWLENTKKKNLDALQRDPMRTCHALEACDARVIEFMPHLATLAVRGYSDAEFRHSLGLKVADAEPQKVIGPLSSSPLFRFLSASIVQKPAPHLPLRSVDIGADSLEDYKAIQARTQKRDDQVNRAVARALQATLAKSEAADKVAKVTANEALEGVDGVIPDVAVYQKDGRVICLEFIWRRGETYDPSFVREKLVEKLVGYKFIQ